MGTSRKSWFGVVREKFLCSPRRETIIVLHTNNTSSNFTDETATQEEAAAAVTSAADIVEFTNIDARLSPVNDQWQEDDHMLVSMEHIAATKIQTYFRSHLARRAYRALRSLVKLQAVVRGVIVRRQARLALECMHALARLQVTVRARQLLGQCPATD